jgi:hypothetical protein
VGVVQHRQADRAEQRSGDRAVPVRADDDQPRRALAGVVGVLLTALIPLFIAYYLAAALLAHRQ